MKTILVVGRDWKFRALLRAQLREENFEALGCETLEEAAMHLGPASPPPAALVFDTTGTDAAETRPQLTALAASRRAGPVVVVAAAHEEFPSPPFHVERRPLRLEALVAAVKSVVGPRP